MVLKRNIFIIFLLLSFPLIFSDVIDISDYDYPRKNQTSEDDYIIPIFGTNDVHGYVFPRRYPTGKGDEYYTGGGVEYMYSYLKILREEWGKQMLWYESGDQFQGGYEFMLSNGSIMNDFYNFAGLDGMAIGNHEFDFSEEFLKKNMNESNFPYLGANLINASIPDSRERVNWPNLFSSKVFQVGEVKIGVIGLGTKETVTTTSIPPKEIIFDDYIYHTVKQAEYLRQTEKVNAVLLLAHFGPQCLSESDPEDKYISKMRNKTEKQKETCVDNLEIMSYLKDLPKGTIDGIIGGHVHDVVHHWIQDIPVIETDGAFHAHIMYLHFKKENGVYVIQNDKTEIEGPLPLCEKIFPDNKRCNYRDPAYITSNLSDYSFHGEIVKTDDELSAKLKKWKDILDEKYKNIIVENEEDLSNCPNGVYECPLVNLVNDITIKTTGADFAFINLGGLRTSWRRGKLSEVDIFLMFPFNNTLVTYEMTGREVERMFKDIENGYSLIPNGGALQLFSKAKSGYISLLSFKVFDGYKEYDIDYEKTYRIGLTDFLAGGGSRFSRVNQWYTPRGWIDHGNNRDMMLNYMKSMKIIKEGSLMDKEHPRVRYIN
ncbi:MAG: bifunctional metallophosphatase/5'-nucleotidase [archaeon]|nr:bifunctional metallophosphatase/5'-nucleotidase [archaeon]